MNAKRTSSGQHEAVKAYRKKLESVQDTTLEQLLDLNRQLDADIEAKKKSDPPPADDAEPPTEPLPKVNT